SGPAPPAVPADRGHHQVVVSNWQIPLRLGQRTALIEGDIIWVPGPSPWPWALLALVAFVWVAAAAEGAWLGLLAPRVRLAGGWGGGRGGRRPGPHCRGVRRLDRPGSGQGVRVPHLGDRLGGGRCRRLAVASRSVAGRPDPAAAGRHVPGLCRRAPRC